MMHDASMRQRVAIVDASPRTREHARRAIRGLGHAPFVFEDIDELLGIGRASQRYALMCFGLSDAEEDLRQVVELCREAVGREVPIMFVASAGCAKSVKDLGRIQRNDQLVAPGSFADLYNALEGFMIRHGLPLAEHGLSWGSYRFYPACTLAKVCEHEVWLNALEFDLALEFFHNVDKPLSSEWLKGMVIKAPARSWPRWLDTRVAHLRTQLGLGAIGAWPTADVRCSGYRLQRVEDARQAGQDFEIERCGQHAPEALAA